LLPWGESTVAWTDFVALFFGSPLSEELATAGMTGEADEVRSARFEGTGGAGTTSGAKSSDDTPLGTGATGTFASRVNPR
jgi:hypothetical protein